jgi:hypothetical protein
MALLEPLTALQTMLEIHLSLFLGLGLGKALGQLLLLQDLGLLLLVVRLQCGVALRELHLACDVAKAGADDIAVPDYSCAAVDGDVHV